MDGVIDICGIAAGVRVVIVGHEDKHCRVAAKWTRQTRPVQRSKLDSCPLST